MVALEAFSEPVNHLNIVAACQQMALVSMVYNDDWDAIRAMVEPQGSLVAFEDAHGVVDPAWIVIRQGQYDWFVVIEGTTTNLQLLGQFGPANSTLLSSPGNPAGGPYGLYYLAAVMDLSTKLNLVLPVGTPAATVRFSGHSMGGAIATILAWGFRAPKYKFSMELMTFGQPRTFLDGWAGTFPPVYARVWAEDDPVPAYPGGDYVLSYNTIITPNQWNILSSEWTHYGQAYQITADGKKSTKPPIPEYREWNVLGGGPFGHTLAAYLERLGLLAQNYVVG